MVAQAAVTAGCKMPGPSSALGTLAGGCLYAGHPEVERARAYGATSSLSLYADEGALHAPNNYDVARRPALRLEYVLLWQVLPVSPDPPRVKHADSSSGLFSVPSLVYGGSSTLRHGPSRSAPGAPDAASRELPTQSSE